tara:strand:+ start:18944 stop:19420 length:477 start_codon:yes stop_codon:yes gene_type:complete
LINIYVHIALLRRDQVFLLRRNRTGFLDGFFCLPGGHLEKDENPAQGALRECREECGIVPSQSPELLAALRFQFDSREGLNFIYRCFLQESDPQPFNAEPHLHDRVDFFPVDNLPAEIPGWLRALAQPLSLELEHQMSQKSRSIQGYRPRTPLYKEFQ